MATLGVWVSGSMHITEEMISDYEWYLSLADHQPIDVPTITNQLEWHKGYRQALEDMRDEIRRQNSN